MLFHAFCSREVVRRRRRAGGEEVGEGGREDKQQDMDRVESEGAPGKGC